MIAVGLALWLTESPRAFLLTLACAAVTFAAGFLLFALGILGGGDGKLLTCVAAIAGAATFREFVLWTLIAGVTASILVLAWKRALVPLLRRGGIALVELARFGMTAQPLVQGEPTRMPYAVVIFAGALATIVSRHLGFSLL
jgi:prepilin peptidase CpaA